MDPDAPAAARIRVLVVDDHPLIRGGLAAMLATQADMALVGEAAGGEDAVAQYRAHRPDVVLMDVRMPGVDGVEATRRIRAEFPGARVVALSTYGGDADVQRALEAGARGYLLKDTPQDGIVAALRAVHAGRRALPPAVAQRLAEHAGDARLTEREVEVLALMAGGRSNKQIAAEIGRSDETVKLHLKHVFEKLGVADRTGAVTAAVRRGLIRLD